MPYQMWIHGAYTPGSSGKVIEVPNPATEEVIDTAPAANAEDVNLAVTAAPAAFPAWKKLPAGQKAEMLHEIAQKLTERSEEFARLLTLEGGKPLVENKDEMGWSAACFRYYAELGRSSRGQVLHRIGVFLCCTKCTLSVNIYQEAVNHSHLQNHCQLSFPKKICIRLTRNAMMVKKLMKVAF